MCSRTHDNCTTKERSRRKKEGTHSETFKTCNFSLLPLLLLLFSLFYLFSSLFFLFFWLLFGCTRKKDFLIRNAKRDARAKVVAAVAGRQRDQRDVRAEVGWEMLCVCLCVCATYPIFPLLRIYYNYYYFFSSLLFILCTVVYAAYRRCRCHFRIKDGGKTFPPLRSANFMRLINHKKPISVFFLVFFFGARFIKKLIWFF